MAPAQIQAMHPDYCMASWHRFYVDIWRANTTVEGVRELKTGFTAFAAEHPTGVGLLTIVESRAPLPSADARAALAAFLAGAASAIKYSAVVHEGTGFTSAAVRGVVTGLTLLARPPYPHKVFATVPQASQWFANHFHEGGKPVASFSELVGALAELRRRVPRAQRTERPRA